MFLWASLCLFGAGEEVPGCLCGVAWADTASWKKANTRVTGASLGLSTSRIVMSRVVCSFCLLSFPFSVSVDGTGSTCRSRAS